MNFSEKYENHKVAGITHSHNAPIHLPMNTKYLSDNPISRWLIRNFVNTLGQLASSTSFQGLKVLDIGCGEGVVTHQLRSIFESAVFHGLDINPELLAVATHLNPGAGFIAASTYALPFADQNFDMVLCTEVLEHLENPYAALSEIKRVGKSFFIFSVPNEPLWRIANMARGAYLREWGNSTGHVNHWSSKAFGEFISKYFDIIAIKRPFPWTLLLCRRF